MSALVVCDGSASCKAKQHIYGCFAGPAFPPDPEPAAEPTIRSRHQFGGARISVMETGTFVIGAHAGYLTTLAVGKGIDVGIHMTRDEARDLLTVLQEALA